MAKLLTVLNVVSAMCSIAGLYHTLASGHDGPVLLGCFAGALIISAYVLLVPASRLERNVRSRLEWFRDLRTGGDILVQSGTVKVDNAGEIALPFFEPFADVPTVEISNASGRAGPLPAVNEVSAHRVVLGPVRDVRAKHFHFVWTAIGIPIPRSHRQNRN